MREATKMGLLSALMIILSFFVVSLIGFSDSTTELLVVAVAAVVAVVATAAAVVVTVDAVVAVVAAVVAVVAVAVVAAAAVVVAAVVAAAAVVVATAAFGKEEKGIAPLPFFLLMVIFVLPLIPGVYYTSHFHNQRQLVKDQQVAEILKVGRQEDTIEVTLPAEYASEHRYLRNTLSFHFDSSAKQGEKNVETETYSWREKEIYCREGDKVWYKVELPFPTASLTTPTLWAYFDHAWEDFEVKLPIKQASP